MPIWSAPVRYVECDQQGVVFNANFLAYADEAVLHLWRRLGLEHSDLIRRGLDAAVVASELQWSSPARWGDVVDVEGVVERVGRTSIVTALTMSVSNRICCRVRTTYVMTDVDRAPTPVPQDLRALLTHT